MASETTTRQETGVRAATESTMTGRRARLRAAGFKAAALLLGATLSCVGGGGGEDVTRTDEDLASSQCRFSSSNPRADVTLFPPDATRVGFDFSTATYTGVTGGDFYINSGQFFANNVGQRGVVSTGACDSMLDPTIPTTGFTRFGVTAVAGNCYVALTHNDERDNIVFRVEAVSASSVSLAYIIVRSGVTLVATDTTHQGYDFSARTYQGVTGGDFYFVQNAFFANNVGQRGVVGVGACSSVDSVTTIPTTGYTQFGVTATAGNCYVALTHNDERDNIVFRADEVTSTTASLTWKLVVSGKHGATLVATDTTRQGYDFSAQTYQGVTGGDFYFVQNAFFANNVGQRGVVSVGACSSVDSVTTIPTTGYTQFGVTATAGNCYVALTHNDERDNIVFRADQVSSTTATLTWKIVRGTLRGATLDSADTARQGFNFRSRTYTGVTGGDFYFVQNAFFANNVDQRGVVSLGACTSLAGKTAPTSGYTRFGVTATAGTCYAALSLSNSCEVILFRVSGLSGSVAALDWRTVAEP